MLRYGSTRRQVLGVEAVLADGGVLRHLDGLEKDNTGYDLAGLICGSEGTLAVITAARLRLVPRPDHAVVALLAFDDVEPALDGVGELRRARSTRCARWSCSSRTASTSSATGSACPARSWPVTARSSW